MPLFRPAVRTVALGLCALLIAALACADDVRVITSGAFTAAYRQLAPQFERTSTHRLITSFGASMGAGPTTIPSRLERREPLDVVILAAPALDDLIARGLVAAGSRVDLVRSRIGMAVRAGAPKPDISSVEALTRTLLAAKSVGCSSSASGVYLSTELFPRLGIADAVKGKLRTSEGPVGELVARGEAEIGFQQISELLPVAGIDYVGPLPPGAQRETIFAAGIVAGTRVREAARALIAFLASPAAAPTIRKTGLDPIVGDVPGVAAAEVTPQDRVLYVRLLDAYAKSDQAAAGAALATWPERRVKDAVRSLDKLAAREHARAAIMLHTEAAFGEAANQRESFHVEIARSFITRLDRQDRDFIARWHALVAALYCVRQDPLRARQEINRGLAVDGKQPDVNLAAGALIEYLIAHEEPNLRGHWSVPKEHEDIIRRQLHQAAQIYRIVLDGHPDFLEARLRLGWTLTLNDSLPAAREQLEIVAARATNSDVVYLAHMFLAALQERADHPAEAAREYALARQVAPYQSSLVALLRATAAAGEMDRARALVTDIPRMVAAGHDDPWHSYNACFTGDELFAGLRAAVRAR